MLRNTFFLVLLVACLLSACSDNEQAPGNDKPGNDKLEKAGQLAAIKQRGELVIATRNAPTVWYINRDKQAVGPEHDMAEAFAKSLGVAANFEVYDSVSAMLAAVEKGAVDMAAGALTRTPAREKRFTFGPDYQSVRQQVVCHSKSGKPRNAADLVDVDELVVVANSSYEEKLQKLKQHYPKLQWTSVTGVGTEWLLRQVWKREIDCTLADSNIVRLNRRYYPSLLMMFDLGKTQHLAWPMHKDPPNNSEALAAAAEEWFADYQQSGQYAAMQDRYYGFLRKWNFVDKNKLVNRIDERYARYDQWFEEASETYGFDEWLLAAQAYQESHWNPEATSATGVRGIMMLTKPTAEAMGVDDRLDPEQSIMGGAKYLRKMEQRLPDDIDMSDRQYFALAAYNIGYAHLRDAMQLAEKLGKDPHEWSAVREVLPLLAQKRYYKNLEYGYARGSEPVRYVRRIRDYGDVIRRVGE